MAANIPIRLGVNIDHVATVRNARGGRQPDPLKAAEIAIAAGADGAAGRLGIHCGNRQGAGRHSPCDA